MKQNSGRGRGAPCFSTRGAQHHYHAAVEAYFRKRPKEALEELDKAIALSPRHLEAHRYRGYALAALDRQSEALQSYRQVLTYSPQDAKAHNEVGKILGTLGDTQKALRHFDQAVESDLNFGEAWSNRAMAQNKLHRLEEALSSSRRAVALLPQHPDAHTNLGALLDRAGNTELALECFEAAIELWRARGVETAAPNTVPAEYARARYNRALCLLTFGRMPEGWAEYEWRWRAAEENRQVFSTPRLTGDESSRGKTVLVHAEQGIGDSIQFSRYLPLLKERGARVLFGIRSNESGLLVLFNGMGAGLEFVHCNDPALSYDFHSPLMSLPHVFRTDLSSIPPPLDLSAPADLASRWRSILGPQGFKIGVCWQGNPQHQRDKERSFALTHLAGLAGIPDVRLISLHKGVGQSQAAQAPFPLENVAERPCEPEAAWLETAGCLSQCDLVVSCDTAVAHLAGTLGIPTFLALPYAGEWRWLRGRADSPWYPSMKIFRQARPGDWPSVFSAIEEAALGRMKEGAKRTSWRSSASTIIKRLTGGSR